MLSNQGQFLSLGKVTLSSTTKMIDQKQPGFMNDLREFPDQDCISELFFSCRTNDADYVVASFNIICTLLNDTFESNTVKFVIR